MKPRDQLIDEIVKGSEYGESHEVVIEIREILNLRLSRDELEKLNTFIQSKVYRQVNLAESRLHRDHLDGFR